MLSMGLSYRCRDRTLESVYNGSSEWKYRTARRERIPAPYIEIQQHVAGMAVAARITARQIVRELTIVFDTNERRSRALE